MDKTYETVKLEGTDAFYYMMSAFSGSAAAVAMSGEAVSAPASGELSGSQAAADQVS